MTKKEKDVLQLAVKDWVDDLDDIKFIQYEKLVSIFTYSDEQEIADHILKIYGGNG